MKTLSVYKKSYVVDVEAAWKLRVINVILKEFIHYNGLRIYSLQWITKNSEKHEQ